MVVYDQSIYVADQAFGTIYEFSLDDAQYISTFASGLEKVEGLALSNC